jgi:uncharacterized protein
MTHHDLILAAMSVGGTALHTPVQVQKLFFLIDKNIAEHVSGPHFDFQPYNYGPFDSAVYHELTKLAIENFVEVVYVWKWREYRLSPEGLRQGIDRFNGLPEQAQDYIRRASEFVRSLSFSELVNAIYKAYPEMRANSVFQG